MTTERQPHPYHESDCNCTWCLKAKVATLDDVVAALQRHGETVERCLARIDNLIEALGDFPRRG